MSTALVRLIVYARDVAALEAFYQTHLHFRSSSRSPANGLCSQRDRSSWHCTWRAKPIGSCRRRLHRQPAPSLKFVFAIVSDLSAHRQHLRRAGVQVGELERYAGSAHQLYDGHDPEGNVFQVMRLD